MSFVSVSPDQLPVITEIPADLHTLVASPGGPLQRVPHDLLLAKLIAASVIAADQATLYANLAHDEHKVALVHNDPAPLKNGWYRKVGASGAGNWIQFEILANAARDSISESLADAAEILSSAQAAAGNAYDPLTAEVLAILTAKASFAGLYDLNACFQDTAGTVVANVGDPVRRVEPVAGIGAPLKQTFGTVFGTLALDSEGRKYIDLPAGAFLAYENDGVAWNHASNYVALEKGCLMAAVVARTVQSSWPLASLQKDGANSLALNNVASGWRASINLLKTGETSVMVAEKTGDLGYQIPAVFSAYLDGATLSAMVDGGDYSPTTEDLVEAYWSGADNGASETFTFTGDILTKPATWPASSSIAGCKYLINALGETSGSVTGSRFYGGMVAKGDFDRRELRVLHDWLRRLVKQDVVAAYDYDVFLVGGQSNEMGATGADGILTQPVVPNGVAYEYLLRDTLRPLGSSADGNHGQAALSGNWMPAFANAYFAATGKRVVFVSGAYSGRGLIYPSGRPDMWSATGGKLVERLALKADLAVQYIENRLGRRAKVRGFIWGGGENDTADAGTLNLASYKAALVAMRDRMHVATGRPNLPMLIMSLDNNPTASATIIANFATIRTAMAEAAAENSGMELIVPYQNYAGAGMLVDAVHLNQAAQNDRGTRAGNACATLFPKTSYGR